MSHLPIGFVAPEEFVRYVRSLTGVSRHAFAESEVDSAKVGLSSSPVGNSSDPHLGMAWFSLLAETAMPPGSRLALFQCGGAWLPMMSRPNAGGRLEGLSNFYTPLFGLVNGEAADEAAMEKLFKSWRSMRGLYEIRFAPMDPEGVDFQRLSSSLKKAGWWVGDYFCFGNWYHRVEQGGWLAYLAGRSVRVRNTLSRGERKIAKAGEFDIEIIQNTDVDLVGGIKAFVEVYGKSWKQEEPFPDFIPGLCRMASARGILRLGVLRLNGQPIAAQLWLVAAGTAYIVKLAYDPAFAQFSPGTVLTAAMFRTVIEDDQVSCIDYLIGDDAYKAEWMSSRRERRGVIAFNPQKIRGLGGAVRHFAGLLMRS